MSEGRYYADIDELKEVSDEKLANAAFKVEGWELLAIKEKLLSSTKDGTLEILSDVRPIYVFGHRRPKASPGTATSTRTASTTSTNQPPPGKSYPRCKYCNNEITWGKVDGKPKPFETDGVTRHNCMGR